MTTPGAGGGCSASASWALLSPAPCFALSPGPTSRPGGPRSCPRPSWAWRWRDVSEASRGGGRARPCPRSWPCGSSQWDVRASSPCRATGTASATGLDRASVCGSSRRPPRASAGTFLILLDERNTWPATFTFRHAIEYLYEGEAAGLVWGAQAFLYPARFTAEGLLSEPYVSIREAWRAPVALHRFRGSRRGPARSFGDAANRAGLAGESAPLPDGAVSRRRAMARGGAAAPGPRDCWDSIGDARRVLGWPRSRLPGLPARASNRAMFLSPRSVPYTSS